MAAACVEFLLEAVEAAEGAGDGLGHVADGRLRRRSWAMIFQNMEWLMWPPPLLRTAVRMFSGTMAQLLASSSSMVLPARSGGRFQRLVQVGDVGVVVLAVVDFHGHLVDVRLQRVQARRAAPASRKGRQSPSVFSESFVLLRNGEAGPAAQFTPPAVSKACRRAGTWWSRRNAWSEIASPPAAPRRSSRTERSCTECPPDCR